MLPGLPRVFCTETAKLASYSLTRARYQCFVFRTLALFYWINWHNHSPQSILYFSRKLYKVCTKQECRKKNIFYCSTWLTHMEELVLTWDHWITSKCFLWIFLLDSPNITMPEVLPFLQTAEPSGSLSEAPQLRNYRTTELNPNVSEIRIHRAYTVLW